MTTELFPSLETTPPPPLDAARRKLAKIEGEVAGMTIGEAAIRGMHRSLHFARNEVARLERLEAGR